GSAPIPKKAIVFAGVSDPVAFRFVDSLARPGGQMTGLSYLGIDLNVKRLQLLKESFPGATRIGVLVPSQHALRARMVHDVGVAATAVGVTLVPVEVAGGLRDDVLARIDAAFETFGRERVDAVLGMQGPIFFRERRRIAELSLRHRLPGAFELAPYVEDGALMAYGPSVTDLYRHAARYTDRILRGAKPAELPVEQPTKVELVVNLKTARALGIRLPPAVLLRTDRVIE
ncbi:MAG TPA: ABC transporter substrate-binding protein, partial [Methylomirabilota bacterium]|nr:ABC transporter substrate-binding protein [Methylomirabilota bacterium]